MVHSGELAIFFLPQYFYRSYCEYIAKHYFNRPIWNNRSCMCNCNFIRIGSVPIKRFVSQNQRQLSEIKPYFQCLKSRTKGKEWDISLNA